MKPPRLRIISRGTLASIARICGPSSGAAAALADGDRRIAAGETVTFVTDRANRRLLVVRERHQEAAPGREGGR